MQPRIMLGCIMRFLNREAELARLDAMIPATEGRLAVVYGRRRVGKTRLLLEWCGRHGGVYTVADQSAPDVQRRYLAAAIAGAFEGFGDVSYPDWQSLLTRLTREARAASWTGPLVIDELPYLALSSPELPSVLQRWIDHDARRAGLKVALCGSSQRMMQGLALSSSAPLYGRAQVLFEVRPLAASHLRGAFGARSATDLCRLHAAWGGVPRYWELAVDAGRDVVAQIDALVLDPLGPLHDEPDRLLLEELPPAVELRPLLDAIGAGAHRVSEIGARLGRPATSLSRPLLRLQELGLVRREVPFGEDERSGKRALYRLDDPFVRLWFRVVAPHRAALRTSRPVERRRLLARHLPGLVAAAWEELCRSLLPGAGGVLGAVGPFEPASRWWRGNLPEWDVVSRSGRALLVGEVKWSDAPVDRARLEALARAIEARPLPLLGPRDAERETLRALFVPEVAKRAPRRIGGVHVVTGADLFAAG